MPPENKKLYNIRVKPSEWEAARKIAEAKGDRISDAVRNLIQEYIRNNQEYLDEGDGE